MPPIAFTPGQKSNLRLILNRALLRNHIEDAEYCICIPPRTVKQKQSTVARTSQILVSNTLGGRTTFGNGNLPVVMDELGGRAGQPGGSFRPPRNRF